MVASERNPNPQTNALADFAAKKSVVVVLVAFDPDVVVVVKRRFH